VKRRALLAVLFGVGASVALADPAHARRRRGGWGRRRSYGYGGGGRRRIARSHSGSSYRMASARSSSQATSYRPVSTRSVAARPQQTPTQQLPDWRQNRRTPGYMDKNEVATFTLKNQSKQSLRKRYGQPMETDGNQDIWDIARTSDGIMAPGRMVVTYDADNRAISAYDFNNR